MFSEQEYDMSMIQKVVGKAVEKAGRTIRDGMDIAEVNSILKANYGEVIVYWHEGGRFELTGAVLYEKDKAPEGMDSVPFGSEYVICAEFGRGVLAEDGEAGGAVRENG